MAFSGFTKTAKNHLVPDLGNMVGSAVFGAAVGTGAALVIAMTIVVYRYYNLKRQAKEWTYIDKLPYHAVQQKAPVHKPIGTYPRTVSRFLKSALVDQNEGDEIEDLTRVMVREEYLTHPTTLYGEEACGEPPNKFFLNHLAQAKKLVLSPPFRKIVNHPVFAKIYFIFAFSLQTVFSSRFLLHLHCQCTNFCEIFRTQ